MFGVECSQPDQDKVKLILSVDQVARESKYIGLPTPEGRITKDKFQSIKEKPVNKFNNWAERNMSSAARAVMIKVVAQAIPTYTMSVFKLPATLCEELMQLTRYFWWGKNSEHRKVHRIAWYRLLLSKNMGGMGFRDLKLFNQALLARQA
jgi:hypothetical protein